ncbi:probable cytochrome P450 12a4, mitochondrial [Dermacentor albipictus]|uniref:probable cytochrome P450 12a4, mitochondrial n=1 Tax=Dermacentor albipictus TaxID=60249 RepID=UPI0038FC05B5
MAALKHYRDRAPKEYADASILHLLNVIICGAVIVIRTLQPRHITEHIKSAALSSPSNTILFPLLLEKKLDFAETVTFTRDIILGGIETVASTATACLLHLAKHTEAQEKARSEVVAAFGKDGAVFQLEHLDRLPYLSACMKESMRMTPAVPGIIRKLNHDTVISGYRIPAKTTINLQTLVASQLEEHFTKPDSFLPERWLMSEEKCDQWVHQTTASLPFGAGRRPCLGRRISELEIINLLSKILLKYRIEHHHPDVEFHEKIHMIPKGPTRLCFKPLQEAKHI